MPLNKIKLFLISIPSSLYFYQKKKKEFSQHISSLFEKTIFFLSFFLINDSFFLSFLSLSSFPLVILVVFTVSSSIYILRGLTLYLLGSNTRFLGVSYYHQPPPIFTFHFFSSPVDSCFLCVSIFVLNDEWQRDHYFIYKCYLYSFATFNHYPLTPKLGIFQSKMKCSTSCVESFSITNLF